MMFNKYSQQLAELASSEALLKRFENTMKQREKNLCKESLKSFKSILKKLEEDVRQKRLFLGLSYTFWSALKRGLRCLRGMCQKKV